MISSSFCKSPTINKSFQPNKQGFKVQSNRRYDNKPSQLHVKFSINNTLCLGY